MCTSHDVDNATDSDDPRSGYKRVADWPHYPPDMHFEMGSGVAVDADGVIYLFTRDIEHWAAHPLALKDKMGKSSISRFNREGEYLGKWGPSDEPGLRARRPHAVHRKGRKLLDHRPRRSHGPQVQPRG